MTMSRDEGSKNAANKNGSTSTTPTTPTSPSATKLCHIVKRPDFEGYGFNLHTEKVKPGQYIGKVDTGSPAETAGLKEGDRILEVNGVNIGQETHKQVVQRIKAIANEVRLLLIDADGIGNAMGANSVANTNTTTTTTTTSTTNGKNSNGTGSSATNGNMEYQGTVQEMPGASPNISSISISTKRSSTASESSSPRHSETRDVPDRAGTITPEMVNRHSSDSNTAKMMTTPPPPSAAIATVPTTPPPPKQQQASNNTTSAVAAPNSNGGMPSTSKPGGLHLQMTAAEMRAKLMSRKKYDPKNENVDLRKKFEIIQKL